MSRGNRRQGNSTFENFAQAGWQHTLGNAAPEARLRFVGSDTEFTEQGVPLAHDAARIRAGLAARVGNNTTVSLGYEGRFGNRLSVNGVRTHLTVVFGQ